MSEREAFERRLEAALRQYVEAAPTRIDAARLTDSLATNVPRVRRLVLRPARRLPTLGFAWILVVAALLVATAMGLVASGALRDLHLLPAPSTQRQSLETAPGIVTSPVTTPPPSGLASPVPSGAPTAPPSPAATAESSPGVTDSQPIGVVLPTTFDGRRVAQLQDALQAAGLGAQILFSRDSAAERADVEALIARDVKVLVLCPWDGAAAAAAADEARAAGVKVIAYDRLILGTTAVDYYVTFDSLAVGAAQAQYLVERAGATRGNNLFLYAGNPSDGNSFLFFEGAWERLQPRIADGTFVIRNSSAAVASRDKATLTHAEQEGIIAQVTTGWDVDTAKSLAEKNLAAVAAADKRTAFILAPNDATARAIADAFAADKAVTRWYVTGQDADRESVQAIIDGRQGMTVFKDPRTLARDTVAGAAAFLAGDTPAATTRIANGAIDVPFKTSAIVAITRANVQAALIDSGYFLAGDFTGTWPGKP